MTPEQRVTWLKPGVVQVKIGDGPGCNAVNVKPVGDHADATWLRDRLRDAFRAAASLGSDSE